ncbi:hypothetical protein GCM10010987_60540 [Bradyrhizobium guangdongense]|nr:hypothetical protein GCM10010987_60540 [Bradyrhizobium guangdongense]
MRERGAAASYAVIASAAKQSRIFRQRRSGSLRYARNDWEQIEVWDDLPRSKVGKVLKPDIRVRLT